MKPKQVVFGRIEFNSPKINFRNRLGNLSLFRDINMATVMSVRKTTRSPTKRGLYKNKDNTTEQKNRMESQKQK